MVKFNSQRKLLPWLNDTKETLQDVAEAHDQQDNDSFCCKPAVNSSIEKLPYK